jgi:hypothetical protein
MHREQLRELMRGRPFRPFTIHLPERRLVEVVQHDFALLSPDGRTLVAYGPDQSFNIIDVMLIASIEVGPPPAPPPPPKPTDVNGPSAA